MNLIPLQSLPNQSLSTILEGVRYDISIVEASGIMSCSVTRNDVLIIENVRITAGTFIFPYEYQEAGNFVFLNLNDDLIYYTNFGTTQNMFYLAEQDLINVRGQ